MKHNNFGADFLHQEFKVFVYRYHPVAAAGGTPRSIAAATRTAPFVATSTS
jgi:hypothetical protein